MTITGAVTDDLGRAVSQAQVLIANLRLSTTTGEDGTYQLFVPALRVDEGTTAQLTARRIGLRAQTVTVALASGLSLTQDFVLESDPFLLEEVVVTGQGLREQRARARRPTWWRRWLARRRTWRSRVRRATLAVASISAFGAPRRSSAAPSPSSWWMV
jgi:hypothetical protein